MDWVCDKLKFAKSRKNWLISNERRKKREKEEAWPDFWSSSSPADTDEVALRSATYMMNTLFYRALLTVVSFAVGIVADYNQSVPLYTVFTITNGVLGGFIFVTHCFCNEIVRESLLLVLRIGIYFLPSLLSEMIFNK
jgi:hypothetical protein